MNAAAAAGWEGRKAINYGSFYKERTGAVNIFQYFADTMV